MEIASRVVAPLRSMRIASMAATTALSPGVVVDASFAAFLAVAATPASGRALTAGGVTTSREGSGQWTAVAKPATALVMKTKIDERAERFRFSVACGARPSSYLRCGNLRS